jgi:hypothetical protein
MASPLLKTHQSMGLKRYNDFVTEMKRYLSGEFYNLVEVIDYLINKYRFFESVSNEFPEIKEDLKKIRFYIEFPYKGKPTKIRLRFGPWVNVGAGNMAEWHGYQNSREQKVVLSRRFFSPKVNNKQYLAGVLFHEIVHSLDPKDVPMTGREEDISFSLHAQSKKLGFTSAKRNTREFVFDLVQYLTKQGISREDFYAKSPAEYDAWISELVFNMEQYFLSVDNEEREDTIIKILDRLREGDYDWVSNFISLDYIDSFAIADKKFLKRLFNAVYKSIRDFSQMKRTPIKISVKIDIGVRKRLQEVLSEEEYEYVLSEIESK